VQVTIVNPGFVRTPLTDKNDFRMPFLMDADRAARIMCSGIERGKKELAFPIPFSWTIQIMRIIPYPIYEWIMTGVWRRMKNKCRSRWSPYH
jgi:short-subunit dehydrogenase